MRVLTIVALLLAVAVGGYAVLMIPALQQEIRAIQSELDAMHDEWRTLHMPTDDIVTVFLIRETTTDFLLAPVAREIATPATPTTALQALITGPLPGENYLPPLPPGTRLEGLRVRDGLATVNFSPEIQENFVGGAQLESLLVESIVATLREFDVVNQVQIMVNGRIVETIGGHVSTDHPLQ